MNKFHDFAAWLETFPGWTSPRLFLEYWRTDDHRRNAISKNGNPLFYFIVTCTIYTEKGEPGFTPEKSIHVRTSCVDIDDGLDRMRAAIEKFAAGEINFSTESVNWLEYPQPTPETFAVQQKG